MVGLYDLQLVYRLCRYFALYFMLQIKECSLINAELDSLLPNMVSVHIILLDRLLLDSFIKFSILLFEIWH